VESSVLPKDEDSLEWLICLQDDGHRFARRRHHAGTLKFSSRQSFQYPCDIIPKFALASPNAETVSPDGRCANLSD